MRSRLSWLALLATLVACSEPVTPFAATTVHRDAAPSQKARAGEVDRRFLIEAARVGLYKLEASNVAVRLAAQPEVRRHAAMLVQHYSDVLDELRALAARRRLVLPASLEEYERASIDQLATLAGEAFDHRFVQAMGVAEHQIDIRFFESAARVVTDTELQAWIAKTLPMLRQHRALAQRLPAPVRTRASPNLAMT